ncbi:MAG: twin-arginine translocase TatA/TatE family subunit [Actinomycetota bacterium]|nr:twin-arginine translocase TatA/TatE family subunit [Actinomycetota bacterium]
MKAVLGGGIGVQEILLLLLLAAVLFGVKKLPSIGRSAGKGLREFKESATSFKEPFDGVKEAVSLEDVKQIRKVAVVATNPKKALARAIFDKPDATPKPAPSEAPTEP